MGDIMSDPSYNFYGVIQKHLNYKIVIHDIMLPHVIHK